MLAGGRSILRARRVERAASSREGNAISSFGEFISAFSRMIPYRFVGENRECELCGSTEYDVVGRRDRYLHALRTVLCRGCGLVFTNPMPTNRELDVFYRGDYRKHYVGTSRPRRKHVLRAFERARYRYRFLKPLLTGRSTILDVGAGGGEFVYLMHEAGHDATGIEPGEALAAYTERQYGVSIRNTGWEDARVAPQSVDLIAAHHVVEHFRHPLAALREFHDWLKPDGHIYISVPDIEDPDKTPFTRFHFAHLFNFNCATLVAMARKAGFEPDNRFGTNSTTLVFRKLQRPGVEIGAAQAENYRRLAEFFREHTNRHLFLSPVPYRRGLQRMIVLGASTVSAQFRRLPQKRSGAVSEREPEIPQR